MAYRSGLLDELADASTEFFALPAATGLGQVLLAGVAQSLGLDAGYFATGGPSRPGRIAGAARRLLCREFFP